MFEKFRSFILWFCEIFLIRLLYGSTGEYKVEVLEYDVERISPTTIRYKGSDLREHPTVYEYSTMDEAMKGFDNFIENNRLPYEWVKVYLKHRRDGWILLSQLRW